MTQDGKRPRGRARKVAYWTGGGVFVLLAVLYGLGYYFTGERLPAGTSIAGVDVSGLGQHAAEERLEKELGPKVGDIVALVRDDAVFEVTAQNSGMTLDIESSVRDAGGKRTFDPRAMVRLLFGSADLDPVIDVDDELMDGEIRTIADELDEPEVEPEITFEDGEPVVREPKTGLRVDQPMLSDLIVDSYLRTTEPQEIPMSAVEPTVGSDALDEALEEYAVPAMSGPVELRVEDKTVSLGTDAFESALRIQVEDGELVPVVDPEELASPLAAATKSIGTAPQDARFVVKSGKPVIVGGKSGRGVQPEELAEELVDVLDKTGDDRYVELEIKEVRPLFDTKDAKKLGIKERVSTFTTYYPPTRYRDINQGRAAELLNGTLLKPGETLSLNETIRERTAANGYVQGGVIEGGKFSQSYGGGVSQVATTTYNAAFFAGLDIIEHKAHSIYLTRYPEGREATLDWTSIDLKVKNTTDHGVLITAQRTPSAGRSRGELRVSMYSTKVWDIESKKSPRRNYRSGRTIKDKSKNCSPQAPVQGFDVDVTRLWKKSGKTVRTETVTTRYNAADRIVCVKDDKDEDD